MRTGIHRYSAWVLLVLLSSEATSRVWAESEIPAPSVERLQAVGAWLKRHGDAIYATQAGPFGRSITAAVQAWGRGPGDFTTVELGLLPLGAGVHAREFKSEMDDLRPLQIRRVRLTPMQK